MNPTPPQEALFSLEAITEVTQHLSYSRHSRNMAYLKAILTHTEQEDGFISTALEPDLLTEIIWDTTDPALLRSRRKNLSTIRNSINRDLSALYQEGKNPDGIALSPDHALVVSQEAKEAFYAPFANHFKASDLSELEKAGALLEALTQMAEKGETPKEGSETLAAQLKRAMEALEKGLNIPTEPEEPPAEEEEIEELDEDDLEEIPEDEIEELDEDDVEEIPEDEIEELDEDDVEEIPEDEIEELDEDDVEESPEDEIEELDEDDVEEIQEENAFDEDPDPMEERASRFETLLNESERYYNRYIQVPAGKYPVVDPISGEETYAELDEFLMGKYPITNALFEVFIGRTGYKTTAEERGFGAVYEPHLTRQANRQAISLSTSRGLRLLRGANWHMPSGPRSSVHTCAHHPVVQVSYDDAMAFASWTGKRLPSLAQWLASGGKTATPYPWGEAWESHLCNTEEVGAGGTLPVDTFPRGASPFGVYDLMGNTMEWICDTLPEKEGEPVKLASGGSFLSDRSLTRQATHTFDTRFSSNVLGFRCVGW